MRHLRLLVLDAQGQNGVRRFADRAGAIALLAQAKGEPDIADILTGLTESLMRGRNEDVRPFIYEQLDRVHDAGIPH